MFVQILAVIAQNMPVIMQQGVQIIQGFLQGILQGLPMIMTTIGQIVVAFLNTLATQLPLIIQAGVNLIVAFIEGIAQGLPQIIQAAVDLIGSFILGITSAIPRLANIAVQAVMQFVYGVGYALGQVLASGSKLIQMFIKGVMNGLSGSRNAGSKNANGVKNGMKGVSLISEGVHLIAGFIQGINSKIGDVMAAAGRIANAAKNKIKSALSIHSPSRVMRNEVGIYIPAGLALGMLDNISAVTNAATQLSEAATVTVPEVDTNNFSRSLTALNSQMDSSGISVNGRLSANNTFNASSRSFEDQVTALIAQAVNKLDNVDQHPEIGLNTLDKMNNYFNKQNVNNWWSAKG